MNISLRTVTIILHDIVVAVFAWLGAYWLRFNLDLPPEYQTAAVSTLLWVVPLQAVVFWRFGLYRGIWRFASLPDLKRIVLAVGWAALLIPLVLILFRVSAVVPRSVLILDPLLLLIVMGGSRLAYRAWKEHRLSGVLRPGSKPVLVAGAGSAADFLLRELARNPAGFHVVGLLDDSRDKQ
jgi:FlaA1/EpsC-like NDP-sugar epimerase